MANLNQQYKTTLDYLYSQLPMFQRVGDIAFKKNLTNIRKLCKALGNPQKHFKTIHIAGTNGKGSVAHLLSSVFQAAGYKTGLYTSPHYMDFRERIKVDGQLVDKAFIIDFVAKHSTLSESIKPSFFEITVAMAFEYFKAQKVDIAIIETGLGGRLDSTNIIHPVLSIITNISFDHQQFLGNTLKSIAKEKAGIIKKSTPVVIGEEQTEVKEVFKSTAKRKEAPISFASRSYKLSLTETDQTHSYYEVLKKGKPHFKNLKVNLHGEYQSGNIATVLKSLENINGFTITEKDIRKGFENLRASTNFIGRWQKLSDHPLVICDSAHNEGGLRWINSMLASLSKDKIHFVFGAVNDKDLGKVMELLPNDAIYYFAKANIPRGYDAAQLQGLAAGYGLKGKSYASVTNAFKAAKRAANENDLVFVGGSIFVVAEIL